MHIHNVAHPAPAKLTAVKDLQFSLGTRVPVIGYGERLITGLFDRVFHRQPVEQRALSLLLAGGDLHRAPGETGANSAPEPYYLR
jgi:hypothetical protein